MDVFKHVDVDLSRLDVDLTDDGVKVCGTVALALNQNVVGQREVCHVFTWDTIRAAGRKVDKVRLSAFKRFRAWLARKAGK